MDIVANNMNLTFVNVTCTMFDCGSVRCEIAKCLKMDEIREVYYVYFYPTAWHKGRVMRFTVYMCMYMYVCTFVAH